jgi:predicted Zn-dependent protease
LKKGFFACKYGGSSTGNALRSATREPSVSPTNLVVEKGRSSLEELTEQVDTGVLLNDFTGDLDPSSGYFNGRGEGSYIKGGEIEYHCKNLHVQGNAFEFLKNVTVIGKEEHCSSEGVYAVPLLTGAVTVIA